MGCVTHQIRDPNTEDMSKAPLKKLSRLALLEQYKRGENITALLRGDEVQNSEEMIEVAYDLQTG